MDEVARQYVELSESWLEQLECVFSYLSLVLAALIGSGMPRHICWDC
jgi:hypothetical protein